MVDDVQWWDEEDAREFSAQIVTITRDFKKRCKLTKMVGEWLEAEREEVPRRLHRSDGFHASELGTRFCGRREGFKRLLPRAFDGKKFSGSLLQRFALGTAAHEHWQRNIYGKMRILKGTWACSRCTYRVMGFMPDHPCPKCGWQVNPKFTTPAPPSSRSKNCREACAWPGGYDERMRDCARCEKGGHWDFRETRIEIPELEIVGHFDGILIYEDEEWILEFKTRRPEDFPLAEPYEDHVIQANIYMRAMGSERGIIVYLNKSTGETTEFMISRDPRVDTLVEHRIHYVNEAIQARELPNGTCSGPKAQDAKACPFSDVCFLGYDRIDEIKNYLRERGHEEVAPQAPGNGGRRLPAV